MDAARRARTLREYQEKMDDLKRQRAMLLAENEASTDKGRYSKLPTSTVMRLLSEEQISSLYAGRRYDVRYVNTSRTK